MRPLQTVVGTTFASLVTLAVLPQGALACSALPSCQPVLVHPYDGEVPADLDALYLYGHVFHDASNATAELTVRDADDLDTVVLRSAAMRFDGDVPLAGQLQPGKRYALTVTTHCADQTVLEETSEISVPATPSAKPTALGSLLQVEMPNKAMVPQGPCAQDALSAVRELQLDTGDMPDAWRNALRDYELVVDGNRMWSVVTAPDTFVVSTPCEGWSASGLSLGTHEVIVRAKLYGQQLESLPTQIELSCEQVETASPALTTPQSKNDGCSLAGAAQAPSAGSFLLFAGLAAWIRRRTSRRRDAG